MFYGLPKGKAKNFEQAINTILDLYNKERVYANDMLICIDKNLSFMLDKKFISCFQDSATNDQEHSLLWRLHTLTWAAKNALNIEGDFVECGVFNGFSSEVIFKYLDFQNIPKKAYLYDTFQGLPEKTSTEEERRKWDYTRYDLESIYSNVCKKFSKFNNVKVVRGIVPDSFAVAAPEKISFLHIDMNSAQAERLTLECLFDKVTPGGYIIFDDFGWLPCKNQMLAELDFMKDRGHNILELPTGQGLVIKNS